MQVLPGELLAPDTWDVLIGHCLGVDHAGHTFGVDSPQMAQKLEQLDTSCAHVGGRKGVNGWGGKLG